MKFLLCPEKRSVFVWDNENHPALTDEEWTAIEIATNGADCVLTDQPRDVAADWVWFDLHPSEAQWKVESIDGREAVLVASDGFRVRRTRVDVEQVATRRS